MGSVPWSILLHICIVLHHFNSGSSMLFTCNGDDDPMEVPLDLPFDKFSARIVDNVKMKEYLVGTENIAFNPPAGWRVNDKRKVHYQSYLLLAWALETYAKKFQILQDTLWLEFGVAKGFSLNLTSSLRKSLNAKQGQFDEENNIVYGFDTFYGLPTNWNADLPAGSFSNGGVIPPLESNTRIIKGLFNETLIPFLAQTDKNIGYVNVDNDLYGGAVEILDAVIPRMKNHGIIHFHEALFLLRLLKPVAGQEELMAFQHMLQVLHIPNFNCCVL